jgi:ZIP family zinc transporter
MNDNLLIAFALTAFAGLSTGIGSALAFFTNKTNEKFLSTSLGFSAGVMIYVSFMEIMPKAQESLTAALGYKAGAWATVGGFFGGVALIALIDKLVPDYENPHEMHDASEMADCEQRMKQKEKKVDPMADKEGLMRMGLMSALAIAIHNFPEGLATFAAALKDPALGIPIAVAVAIHNIPEGIAVSVPIYFSTGSKKKAFGYSFLSGLSEPVGALVGYLLLRQFFNDLTFGVLFAVVAGIMVYISIDELLPASEKYGEHHLSIYGMIGGMGLMALSLLLFL